VNASILLSMHAVVHVSTCSCVCAFVRVCGGWVCMRVSRASRRVVCPSTVRNSIPSEIYVRSCRKHVASGTKSHMASHARQSAVRLSKSRKEC